MLIVNVRHDMPKKSEYIVDRPFGRTHYTFAHYSTPVEVRCGDRAYSLQPGACIVFAPNVPQWLYSPGDLLHSWLHLEPEAQSLMQHYGIPINKPFYPHNSNAISGIFQKMEAEFFANNPFRETLLDGYVHEFLIWLHRAMRDLPVTWDFPASTVQKIRQARKVILAEPERKWSLAEMAALVPLSPSRFHTIYKAIFGTTPSRDLIQARVELATNLLRTNPEITLEEVAELSGYSNQYHLIRQFKEIIGQTPGQYRTRKR